MRMISIFHYYSFICSATDYIGPRFLDHTHTHTHTHYRVGLPWTSDKPVTQAATYTAFKKYNRRSCMHAARLYFVVLCTSSIPVSLSWLFCILPFTYNTQHKHPCPRWNCFCSLSVLYPYFLVLTILSFPFCPYHATQTSMPLAGFEPAIPASERPQTHAVERAATGIDFIIELSNGNLVLHIR